MPHIINDEQWDKLMELVQEIGLTHTYKAEEKAHKRRSELFTYKVFSNADVYLTCAKLIDNMNFHNLPTTDLIARLFEEFDKRREIRFPGQAVAIMNTVLAEQNYFVQYDYGDHVFTFTIYEYIQ